MYWHPLLNRDHSHGDERSPKPVKHLPVSLNLGERIATTLLIHTLIPRAIPSARRREPQANNRAAREGTLEILNRKRIREVSLLGDMTQFAIVAKLIVLV